MPSSNNIRPTMTASQHAEAGRLILLVEQLEAVAAPAAEIGRSLALAEREWGRLSHDAPDTGAGLQTTAVELAAARELSEAIVATLAETAGAARSGLANPTPEALSAVGELVDLTVSFLGAYQVQLGRCVEIARARVGLAARVAIDLSAIEQEHHLDRAPGVTRKLARQARALEHLPHDTGAP